MKEKYLLLSTLNYMAFLHSSHSTASNPFINYLNLQHFLCPLVGVSRCALPQVLCLVRGLPYCLLRLSAVLHGQAQLCLHHLLQLTSVQRAAPQETATVVQICCHLHSATGRGFHQLPSVVIAVVTEPCQLRQQQVCILFKLMEQLIK